MGGFLYYFFSSLFLFLIVAFLVAAAYSGFLDYFFISSGINSRSWFSPYECGSSFNSYISCYLGFTYTILLVFFVVFDLEVVLLLNLPLQQTLYKGFWYYLCFLFVLTVGYLIESGRGYADWSF